MSSYKPTHLQPTTPGNPTPPSKRMPRLPERTKRWHDEPERLYAAFLLGFEHGAHGLEARLVNLLTRDGLEQALWREGFTRGKAAREKAEQAACDLAKYVPEKKEAE